MALDIATATCPTVGIGAASAVGEKDAEEVVPVFAQWQDSVSGVLIDTQLWWHSALPEALPEGFEEPICVVSLRAPESPTEFFEARMQRHHLQTGADGWARERLERLMNAMAQPGGRMSDSDTVLLRRESGRMVIDVLFRPGSGPGPEARVVDILNAYPAGTSSQTDAVRLLRSVALAQRRHRRSIMETQAKLEEARSSLADVEKQWADACGKARKDIGERFRQFYLVLQAKIDKERALHATAVELRREVVNSTVVPPTASATAPLLSAEVSTTERANDGNGELADSGRGRVRKGGRGGRGGARRGAATARGAKRARVEHSSSPERDAFATGAFARDAVLSKGVANIAAGSTTAAAALAPPASPPPVRQRNVVTMPGTAGLFDPVSSDDEAGPPRNSGTALAAPALAAPAKATSTQSAPLAAAAAPLSAPPEKTAAALHSQAFANSLFFSDDE